MFKRGFVHHCNERGGQRLIEGVQDKTSSIDFDSDIWTNVERLNSRPTAVPNSVEMASFNKWVSN